MSSEATNPDAITSNVVNGEPSHSLNLDSVSSDLTDLLDKRLEGWSAMVRSLTDYFHEVADGEEAISKKLTKTSDTLKLPATEVEKQQFLNSESPGIVQLMTTLKGNNQKLAEHHSSAADFINNTTLVELKDLKNDVKKLSKEIKSNHSSLNMRFAKARETSKTSYKKLARSVAEIIDVNQVEGEDPWIVHHSFQRQLKRDLNEDAAFQDKVKESVANMKTFEDSVMGRFKSILSGYYQWRNDGMTSVQGETTTVKEAADAMANDGEWNAFLERYPNQLKGLTSDVKPKEAVDETLANLEYPLKAHPYVETTQASAVQRRSGVGPFKSWKEQHLVLTATGFLYGFPSADLLEHKEPDFGLQLKKSQVITGKKDFDFEVVGKSLGGGLFSSEKHFQFRTNSPDERATWLDALQKWGTVSASSTETSATGATAAAAGASATATEAQNTPAEPAANAPQDPTEPSNVAPTEAAPAASEAAPVPASSAEVANSEVAPAPVSQPEPVTTEAPAATATPAVPATQPSEPPLPLSPETDTTKK